MNRKDVFVDGRKFVITYPNKDVEYYKNRKFHGIIDVLYYPEQAMKGEHAENIVEEHKPFLLQQVLQIIEENRDFYDHFEVDDDFTITGYTEGYSEYHITTLAGNAHTSLQFRKKK